MVGWRADCLEVADRCVKARRREVGGVSTCLGSDVEGGVGDFWCRLEVAYACVGSEGGEVVGVSWFWRGVFLLGVAIMRVGLLIAGVVWRWSVLVLVRRGGR